MKYCNFEEYSIATFLGVPYVTAEASLSARHETGAWAERQDLVAEAVRTAAVNICFTARDRAGIAAVAPPATLADLPPFIDTAAYGSGPPRVPDATLRLVTVAMLRPGDKLRSYRLLGETLARLTHLDWTLTVVGDGAARDDVRAALAPLGPSRVAWRGAVPSADVAAHLLQADLFVWPGFAEAFGLCYLEAQASGIPVVAVRNAGTPSVIRDGETGILTEADASSYAAAIEELMGAPGRRQALGAAAAAFVRGDRSLPAAAKTLDTILQARIGERSSA